MINFVLTTSKNYALVQEQILGLIKKHLPVGSYRESWEEYIDGCLNFTLFINKEADIFMSHGVADKNYHLKKMPMPDGSTDRLNNQKKRKYLFVPGEWLKARLIKSGALNIAPENIVAVGWPRLDYLREKGNEVVKSKGKKVILWAPTHDHSRAPLSSYPEFEKYIPLLQEKYDVRISLHPRNRKDKKPTDIDMIDADVVVTDFGTMVYEAIALGKKVIFPSWIIRDRVLKRFNGSAEYFIFKNNYGNHASSFEDLLEMIESETVMSKNSADFFANYLQEPSGGSGKKIADLLISMQK